MGHAEVQEQQMLSKAIPQPDPRICDTALLSMAFDSLNASSDSDKSSQKRHDNRTPTALTKESLFFLNLSNEKQQSLGSNFTTTPELTSSSSSSLASFDEGSKDHQKLQRIYNNSNSSIATIVQRFASSSSTLDLQGVKDLPQHNNIQHIKDFSTTSLSSLNSNNDTASVTTDTTTDKPRRLKSSLKLPGLHRCKSLPSTAKTVRFSTDLTKVKTFNEHARPSSISLDNSPESSPGRDDDDNYDYGSTPKAFFDLKSSSFLSTSSSDSDSEDDYFTYRSKLRHSSWKLQATNYDFFSIQHRPQLVKLTSLAIRGTQLVGSVEVRNISFEKYIEIKFTTDGWNSIYLITASYARSVDSMNDQFNFHIDLNNAIMMNSSRVQRKNSSQPISVELCVKYVSNGSDIFYDNNGGQNYRFQLISTLKKKHRSVKPVKPSSSIDHNFVQAKISAPPKIMTSGRYFSDDTDYFNSSPSKFKWFEPSTTGTTTASSSLKSSTNTSQETLTHLDESKPEKSGLSKNDSYSDFLQKYCFFKSDEKKNLDVSDSLFIR
jgi:hypothetical protein